MTFKEAWKIQLKEYKEMAKNPWFWVIYILIITLLNYLDIIRE